MVPETARDEIRIENLEVFAHHGVYPEETKEGQTFFVNAALYTDVHKAGRTDALEDSTNYGDVCYFITNWMQENTCKLLEAVAERLSRAILLEYPLIAAVELEIRKPEAPIPLPFGCVSVKVRRGWHRAYVALGSNMGDRKAYLDGAVEALKAHPQIRVSKLSDFLETKPYGVTEQADFLNGAVELETLLEPEELLEALHELEAAADRKRVLRWGPRTLDLDILFYDALVYESDTLIIPHPDLANRDFVLKPMRQIAPHFRHPVSGKTTAQLLEELEKRSV